MSSKPFASSADLTEKTQTLEVLADGVYALTAEGDPNVGAVEGEDFVVAFEALATPVASVMRTDIPTTHPRRSLQGSLQSMMEAGAPEIAALDARIRSSISSLVAQQQDSGGWRWSGGSAGDGDRAASARVLWGLSLAQAAGYRVEQDAIEKAKNFLKGQMSQVRVQDLDSKAVLLHALAAALQRTQADLGL